MCTWLCLSALSVLRAQGYEQPDVADYHSSSVYYVTLRNGSGESINDSYSTVTGALGAFVGGELRGVGVPLYTDPAGVSTVFMVRVWGGDDDPATVSFRMRDGSVEYQLGTHEFGCGSEATYGSPSLPIALTLIPLTGMELTPSNVSVLLGLQQTVQARLLPVGHSTVTSVLTYEFRATGSEDIFSTEADGPSCRVTGLKRGTGTLSADVKADGNIVYGASAQVSVLIESVAVTGLRNDMPSTTIDVAVGDVFSLAFTVLPENATNRAVTYAIADADVVYDLTDDYGQTTFTALAEGETTITVTTDDGGFFIRYNVRVGRVRVTNIEVSPASIDVLVGEQVNTLISYTVLPANAKDKSVTMTARNPEGQQVLRQSGSSIYANAEGTATVVITSNDNPLVTASVTVNVTDRIDPLTLTYPDELTLSRLYDVALTLAKAPADARLQPARLQVKIGESANGGWGPAATATMSDATGLRWMLRGRYVGTYSYSIVYNGEPQKTESGKQSGTLHIPAEYTFQNGWDWISLYAAPAPGSIVLRTGDDWLASMQIDAANRIIEIRSQRQQLMSDGPSAGFFGTLEALSPTDGMYKVYSQHTTANTNRMAFSAGYDNLVRAHDLSLPQTRTGYTWITYPHEIDHTVKSLNTYLSSGAEVGDQIIGQDFLAEYNGINWESTPGATFRAGRGYMYYTEGAGGKNINWGPATLWPDEEVESSRFTVHSSQSTVLSSQFAVLSSQSTEFTVHSSQSTVASSEATPAASASDTIPIFHLSPFTFPSRFPDIMPVVAALPDVVDPEHYAIVASVGDECRGVGLAVESGLMHITVAGEAGDRVTFTLLDLETGATQPLGQTLAFARRAGSHRQPVTLTVGTVNNVQCAMNNGEYDLQGRHVEKRSGGQTMPGIRIVVENGQTKKIIR